MAWRSPLVVGINGGGTQTTFALVDADLNVIARSQAGQTNYHSAGVDIARESLRNGMAAIRAAVPDADIAAIGAGISGIDRPEDHAFWLPYMQDLLPEKPVILDNDAIPALVAGIGRKFGIVTISGTGMICMGINGAGDRARAGGWGHYLDPGSGYLIARALLNAIAQAYDGSGMRTALTDRVLARLGLESPMQIIGWLYVPERKIAEIASLAREAVQAAADGDLIATRIMVNAARALATETLAAARALGFDHSDAYFPILMSGGIFMNSALLRDYFTQYVQTFMPNAVTLTTDRDAALGAGMMALDALGVALPAVALPAATERPTRMTERRSALTMDIHTRPTLDIVGLMNVEDERVPLAIHTQIDRIAALIDAIAPRFEAGGRIFLVGAGTSGRLAVLDAAECLPTFSVSPDHIAGILAGGEAAMIHAIEGAEDNVAAGAQAIADRNIGERDTVIGVAASGSTPFVVGALKAAAARKALTGSLSSVVHAPISALVAHPLEVPTGPEVLTGSTRLKSGSAQKMVLNMISTGVMMRVGRTFGNLMTDMLARNVKLRGRAITIVAEATGLDRAAAEAVLSQCDGEMKTAIAVTLLGVTPAEARARLTANHGNLVKVVQAISGS